MYGNDEREAHSYRGEPRGDRRDHQRHGTPLSDLDPALTDVSRRLIGCAIDVHRGLGPGYEPAVYLNALCAELDEEGISYEKDHAMEVRYRDRVVGSAVADLFVGERFLVMLLAEPMEIGTRERSCLRAQLRAADLELGLIVNFGERRLKDGLVRVLNPDKLNAIRDAAERSGDEPQTADADADADETEHEG